MADSYAPPQWTTAREYTDITYRKSRGVARIAFNRPEVRNAFRPETLLELQDAFRDAGEDPEIGVVLLTGEGPAADGKYAFCSGGDQRVRGDAGYVGGDGLPRLNVLELQRYIRSMPKPVICLVAGYAIGGGHVLHVICDLTLAAENAVFGQTGPKVGSFDGGFGASYLASIVGQKKAREIWYLCRRYSAAEAMAMGLVNTVVPHDELDAEVDRWCAELMERSPTALALAKRSFNADTESIRGIASLGMHALSLYYDTEESREGGRAFREKRPPQFRKHARQG